MNLLEHYESYRESVMRDALEGFTEYAKKLPTADPGQWPTVYHYLQFATHKIKEAITKSDEVGYRKWLSYHKEAILSLFEHMVTQAIHDSGKAGPVAILDLIQTKGWNWSKFSKILYQWDKFAWVPRHGIYEEWPALDSDEMKIVMATKSKSWSQKALELKNERCKIVGWDPQGFAFKKLDGINVPTKVTDWTQELFPWEQKTVSTAS